MKNLVILLIICIVLNCGLYVVIIFNTLQSVGDFAIPPREKIRIAKVISKLQYNPYRKDMDIKKLRGYQNVTVFELANIVSCIQS